MTVFLNDINRIFCVPAWASILKIIACLACMFFSAITFATLQYQAFNQQDYNNQNDFPYFSVYDIEEDTEGYIWFATQLGLVKFDGYSFTSFKQNNDVTKGLLNDFVYDLEVDAVTGNIWIATAAGLSRLNPQTEVFRSFQFVGEGSSSQNVINTIYQDSSAVLWAGTEKGLYKQTDNDTFEYQSVFENRVGISDIASLENGKIVLATNAGIKLFNPKTGQIEKILLEELPFLSLFVDKNNSIWAGSNGQGLYLVTSIESGEELTISRLSVADGLADNIVNSIVSSEDNAIWVGTTAGISIFPGAKFGEFINYQHKQSENEDEHKKANVISLLAIDNKFLFVGTTSSGFSILDRSSNFFSNLVAGSSPTTYSVTHENDNSIWVASDSGVYNVDSELTVSGPFANVVSEGASLANKVTFVHFSKGENTLWAGSRNGLSQFNKSTQLFEMIGFKNKRVYSINEDEFGFLWIGTTKDGIFKFDQKTQSVVGEWSVPHVFRIMPVDKDMVWVATIAGLFLINPSTEEIREFTSDIEDPESLPFDTVTWIGAGIESDYVIGTHSKGVAKMYFDKHQQRPIFTPVLTDTIVSTLPIGAVVKDKNNSFWITTTKGIARADSALSKMDYFDESDGAHSDGYFIGSQTERNGHLYFGGPSGITHFNPDDINKDPTPPRLKFTRVSILNKEASSFTKVQFSTLYNTDSSTPSLTLTPDNIVLRIQFAALEYGAPENIKYQYKLENFHQSWQHVEGETRQSTFTNLIPGKYTFKVKTTNRFGEWNANYETLEILVLAPWWQTTIARIGFLFATLLAFLIIYHWRTRSLVQASEKLSKMVEEKTKDLELANNKMLGLINLDPLTEIYNRRGFLSYSNQQLSRYKRNISTFSIVLLDIDHFKEVNDVYGHDVGDASLVYIAKLLKKNLRPYDIVARWGGEEFIVLLPDTNLELATRVANKLRKMLDESTANINEHELSLTVSGGVSEIAGHESLEPCIKQADERLYQSKADGRNKITGAS